MRTMFWADEVTKKIRDSGKYKPLWVDDMKTPSGFAHVGSLMGPLIHSLIFKALKDSGEDPKFTFVINDFDPVDGLSSDLVEKFTHYLGYPLKSVPSPEPGFD